MPTSKNKRKASTHAKAKKSKIEKSPGLITKNPKFFGIVGVLLVLLSSYLLLFKSQDNAMFGLAMLSLISGVAFTVLAKISVSKSNTNG
jgi:hypothetical protein